MTRFVLLVLVLFSFTASAQQYVRPSKGTSFSPLSTTGLDGGYYLATPTGGLTFQTGPIYDWSAFEAVRVRLYAQTDGINPLDGGLHSNDLNSDGQYCSSQSRQYTVSELGAYARFSLVKMGTSGWYLRVQDTPTPTGPYALATGANNSVALNGGTVTTNFTNCWLRVQVTPIPFAPPAISGSVTIVLPDGGTSSGGSSSTSAPTPCGTGSVNSVFTMDGGAITMNTLLSGGAPTAQYIVVCNSKDNTSGTIRCRADGTSPTTTTGSAGLVLDVGDCVPYTTTGYSTVKCIGANTNYVSAYECAP